MVLAPGLRGCGRAARGRARARSSCCCWPRLWALRLAGYITWRHWGHDEDRRYREIRARNEPHFAWKSLYLVFGLQALLAWVVSLPLVACRRQRRALGLARRASASRCSRSAWRSRRVADAPAGALQGRAGRTAAA